MSAMAHANCVHADRRNRRYKRRMDNLDRRSFLAYASSLGAALAWAGPGVSASRVAWTEQRQHFPQGVASGDPEPHSVILWTRRPFADGKRRFLIAEIARDPAFRQV